MKTLRRAGIAIAFSAGVAGCVAAGTPYTVIPPGKSREAILIGESTKADVLAALGKTTSVSFDSGYEVWVYQYKGEMRGGGEFVVLFAPSGIVAKTRIRPTSPPAAARARAPAAP
ncbi:MAG: hypothetical protein ABUU24_02290 [Variovorax sp.]